MKIARGIFFYQGRGGERIRPGASSSNVTVVQGRDAIAMIDTGVVVGGAYRELLANIHSDNLSLNDLSWILFTHAHWDHINASGVILARQQAKTAAGKNDIQYFEDARRNFDGFVTDFGELTREMFPYPLGVVKFLMFLAWGRQPKLDIDRALYGGEIIDIGREIQSISLPGHTPGHMGYFIPDEGVLVLGDHIDFENAQGVDLNNPHSDYESAMESLSTIINFEPEIMIPGHGEVISGRKEVQHALDEVLSFDQELPELLYGSLSKGPLRLKELTYMTFKDITLSIEAMTMMLVLNVLLYMEKEGQVQRIERAGQLFWQRN